MVNIPLSYREVVQDDSMLLADVAMDQPRRDPSMKHSHSELDVNRADEYFQGDVELSEEQAAILQQQLTQSLLQDDFHRRVKRKIGRVRTKTCQR